MESSDAAFYETAAAGGERYAERYQPLYAAAIALIPIQAVVVELGCGTGRFAALARLHVPHYLGLDFAPALIAEAGRYTGYPDLFRVADLRTDDIPDADCYVALEVLEHLDDDLAILARLPKQSRVVMSVPSFHSKSHVRHFPAEGEAAARYDLALKLDHEERVPLPSGAFFHLLSGTVRAKQKKAAA